MEALETLLNSGGEFTFAALFVALLFYVMKTNDKREEQYRETIATLSTALAGYEDLKQGMLEIKGQLHDLCKK